MISLETPRADNPDLNNKVHVANGFIRCSFYKKDRVSIIDNSNLASQGQPIIRFFNVNDKSHLSAQGTSLLASNVRSSLDKHFGIKDDKGENFQESGGRGRRQYGVFTLGGLGILVHKVDILGSTVRFDTNYLTYCLSSI